MKKALVALAVSAFIFGCSESEDKSNSSAPLTPEAVTAFKNDFLGFRQALESINNMGNNDRINIAYKSFEEKDNKVHFDFITEYTDLLRRNDIKVELSALENNVANLKKYGPSKGEANIEGLLNVRLKVQEGEVVHFDSAILSDGKNISTIDHGKKKITRDVTFEQQKHDIMIQSKDFLLGSYELAKSHANTTATFDKSVEDITAIDQSYALSNFKFSTPKDDDILAGTVTIDSLTGSSKYELSPIKMQGEAVFDKILFSGKVIADSYSINLPKITVSLDVGEKDKKVSGTLKYLFDDVIVDFGTKGKGAFGQFIMDLGLSGIQISDDWKKLLELVQAIENRNNELTEEEAKELFVQAAKFLTKDSRFDFQLNNKISTGEEAKVQFSIQPSERFVTLAQNNFDELDAFINTSSPDQVVDSFLENLTFTLVVPENYYIEQFAKVASFNGKDIEKAREEAKTTLQQSVAMAAMLSISLGVTPVKYENNTVTVNISYANQKWEINGKQLTTKELFGTGLMP